MENYRVHCFKMDDLSFALDVASGLIHIIDDIAFDIIGLISLGEEKNKIEYIISKKYSKEEFDETYEEIQELIDNNKLFTEEKYDIKASDLQKRTTVIKAMCLHVAHDCNLACKYCFASEGEYKGERSLMDYEVGKKAFDFLVEKSGKRRNLEVDFFGGEPLMNFKVVRRLVEYAKGLEEKHDKKFRFTITTNGVLLNDEITDYINENMSNVVLSIDGRKCVNDNMRPFRNGKGSYDLILPKFKDLVNKRGGKSYYARGTYTAFNKDFTKDVLHLSDEGFEHVSVEPVIGCSGEPYAITDEEVDELVLEYENLAREIVKYRKENKKINFFHFNIDLEGGPCIYKRITGCGAGHEYVAITPKGDIYPCHQFVGNEEFKMGDVFEKTVKESIVKEFKCANVYAKMGCNDCFAKYYCSGGCSANGYNFLGDILKNHEPWCKLQRKRVEMAIYLKAKSALNN